MLDGDPADWAALTPATQRLLDAIRAAGAPLRASKNDLAEMAGVSPRTVANSVRRLAEVGLIRVERGGGRGNISTYFALSERVQKGAKGCNEKGAKRVQKGANCTVSEPSREYDSAPARVVNTTSSSFQSEEDGGVVRYAHHPTDAREALWAGWGRERQSEFIAEIRDALGVGERSRHAADWLLAHHEFSVMFQAGATAELIRDAAAYLRAEAGMIVDKPPRYLGSTVARLQREFTDRSNQPEPAPRAAGGSHGRSHSRRLRPGQSPDRVYVTAPDGSRMDAGDGMLAAAIRFGMLDPT